MGLFGPPNIGKLKAKSDVQGLIKALKYKERGYVPEEAVGHIREQAARALGEIRDVRAVEPLIQALKDEVFRVRRNAAMALGEIKDVRAVEPLIQALKDKNKAVRGAVAYALGETKDKRVVKPLIKALKDKDAEVRERIGKVLDKIGWMPKDDSEKAQYLFARAQWKELAILGKSAVEPLIQALKDEDRQVRYKVAEALGKIRNTSAVVPFREALRDKNLIIRKKAAELLGYIGDTNAVESFIQALKDKNRDIRESAAKALKKLGWKPRDDTMKAYYLIAKNNWHDIVRLGKSAVEPLIQALNDEDWQVRKKATEALGKIGDGRAVESLIQVLKDEDSLVRQYVAEALGKLGDQRAVGPLITALKKSISVIRCLYYNELNEPIVYELDELFRYKAAEALGTLGSRKAVESLVNIALTDKEGSVRRIASDSLTKLVDPSLGEYIREMLKDRKETMSRPVWEAAFDGTLDEASLNKVIEVMGKDSGESVVVFLAVMGDSEVIKSIVKMLNTPWSSKAEEILSKTEAPEAKRALKKHRGRN